MSNIPYRAIPISLETHPEWLKLSLKRRELFRFLVFESVSSESHEYRGKHLTYGQYVWSLNKLRERFNETLSPEDQYSRSGLQEALDHLCKIGFLKKEKFLGTVQSQTLITILYSDCYELIKKHHRTPFDDLRTPSVHLEDSSSVQSYFHKNNPDNISKDENCEFENTPSVHPKISLNNDPPYTYTESTRTNTNDVVYERQCPDNAFSKKESDDVDVVSRFKLSGEELKSYEWLEKQKIDTPKKNLSWWSKSFSLKRIKEVHKAAVKAKDPKGGKKKSVGALMTFFFKNNVVVECDFSVENKEFVPGFFIQYPEIIWNIEKTCVVLSFRGINKEIPLNYTPNLFVDTLLRIIENLKGM